MTQPPSSDVLRGTLDLLVLRTLTLEPNHGWGISQRIQQISRGVLDVNQGSLYPALQRLEQKGWIESEWRTTENNRQGKYYSLNGVGAEIWSQIEAGRSVAEIETHLNVAFGAPAEAVRDAVAAFLDDLQGKQLIDVGA